VATAFVAKRHHVGLTHAFQFGELWRAFRASWLSLLLPVIIIGGIRGGVFTPTEAGAVSVLCAMVVSAVYREMRWRDLPALIVTCVRRTGMVMFLVAMAMVVASLLTTAGIAQTLVSSVASISTSPLLVLLLLLLVLVLVGVIMDLTPAILILAPMMLPVVIDAGISPVYFGVLMVLVLGIGLLTPPVGTGLYIGCVVGKVTVEELVRSLPPFYLALLAVVAIIVAFPPLVFLLL
jgi:tripartite ATP-independent transporter DctM subunit